MVEDTFWANW